MYIVPVQCADMYYKWASPGSNTHQENMDWARRICAVLEAICVDSHSGANGNPYYSYGHGHQHLNDPLLHRVTFDVPAAADTCCRLPAELH